MSARPRPRPRPRNRASKESSTQVPASQDASTSFVIAPGKVDDVVKELVKDEVRKPEPVDSALEYFMRNKNGPRNKQRAATIAKQQREEVKVAQAEYDLDQEISEPESPGTKRKMKNSILPTAPKTKLPAWAQDIRNISPVVSDDGSDIQIIEVPGSSEEDDLSPRTKRARLRSREPSQGVNVKRKDKGKARKRSSSPELSDPPALTADDLADARAAFRSVYPRPAPRASSPDAFANRSADSITALNPELQELAKRVRKNNTRASSEAASGKPEIVTIRVIYHPHPQDPPNGNPIKSWAFKMKRTDEMKPIFAKVAETMFVPINRIKICHNGVGVFKFATPDSIRTIWDEADFDAYLDSTLQYMSENQLTSPSKAPRPSLSSGGPPKPSAAGSSSKANDSANDKDDVAEQLADDTIKLYLQGSSSNKKIPVKTRRTTTAMSLIRHYLKASGIGDFDEGQVKKRRIRLEIDGEEIEYDCTVGEIADGELEGDECLDVVGV